MPPFFVAIFDLSLKDSVPLLAAVIAFLAALSGASLGAYFTGRTERLKLLRAERLKACAELMGACRTAISAFDTYRRYEAFKDGRFEVEDPDEARKVSPTRMKEQAEKLNEAKAEAWSAYHRLRVLGPEGFVQALQKYWNDYEDLLRSELDPAIWSLDFARLREREEELYAAAAKILTK